MNFADARRGCFLYGFYSGFVTSAIIRKSREKFDLVNFSVSCRREARSGRQDAFFLKKSDRQVKKSDRQGAGHGQWGV